MNKQTLREFYTSYECDRKFDNGKEVSVIIDGNLMDLSYNWLVIGDDSKYLDYHVIDWTHTSLHMVISIVSDYDVWLKVEEYRKELFGV